MHERSRGPHDYSDNLSRVAEILSAMVRETRTYTGGLDQDAAFTVYLDTMRAHGTELTARSTAQYVPDEYILASLTFRTAFLWYGIRLLETGLRQQGMEVILVQATNALREIP